MLFANARIGPFATNQAAATPFTQPTVTLRRGRGFALARGFHVRRGSASASISSASSLHLPDFPQVHMIDNQRIRLRLIS